MRKLIKGYKGEHKLEKTSSYNKDQVQKIIELLEQINRALNQKNHRNYHTLQCPKKTLAIRSGKMRLQEF
ncbi:hypothetical protein [Helicobacter pylori]|uniref:hypothetical protein n=1 Tax=Helicobacter pylori TaxID=210 RepID=UPI001375BFD4|nr:hypothetical protein [Helicobacter pylori]